ncbi:transcription-repair coupling factor [Stigmatella aurantiaca DW4/3-1]|uniref:Transcription-repair coupling factor n=1 Tax=Stigmatella aurantiaca (strain DW4/3-1) TaxID=378806 RepID=Q09E47_STIAD|nr:transcription-repair coupling factor [Stigmatella aurantiaca DW4/3-1]
MATTTGQSDLSTVRPATGPRLTRPQAAPMTRGLRNPGMDTPFSQTAGSEALRGAVPPTGDPFARLLERLQPGHRARTQGLHGAARGHVLARLSRTLKAPLVCVAVDEEAADALAGDLAFFLGGNGTLLAPRVLRLPADEVLPYDELSPEPHIVSERLGTLFHLSQGTRFPALVLSLRALLRRVLPVSTMTGLAQLLTTGQDIDRDTLARQLVLMGYQSSPLVEDPGTFSVRGGILDVFSPLYERPVRLEFFGDTIESIRLFEPDNQRTVDSLKEVSLVPARELLLTDQTRAKAEATARAVADHINLPTIKLRERLDALREGLPGFGLEGLLPGFFEGGLATVFDYLRLWAREPVFYFDDPVGLERAATDLWEELERSHQEADARQDLTLPPSEHFLTREQADAQLAGWRGVEGGGAGADPRRAAARPLLLWRHAGSARGHPRPPRRGGRPHPAGGAPPAVAGHARGVRHRLWNPEPGGPAQAPAAGPPPHGPHP